MVRFKSTYKTIVFFFFLLFFLSKVAASEIATNSNPFIGGQVIIEKGQSREDPTRTIMLMLYFKKSKKMYLFPLNLKILNLLTLKLPIRKAEIQIKLVDGMLITE